MTTLRTRLQPLRRHIHLLLHPRHKIAFLVSLPPAARLFDIGCGNNSASITKQIRPDLHYTGIDVCDYEQDHPVSQDADEYILATPENFASEITKHPNSCDAVICNHNLEHCLEPDLALHAMLLALKRNGHIYLAFPCVESLDFPHREGTLNFFDDPTHVRPPDFDRVMETLRRHGCEISYARRRYRPWRLFLIGLLLEPRSARQKKVIRGTWAFYGFETLIWAKKLR